MRSIDLTGHKYGRLLVIKEVANRGYGRRWLCRCECGVEKSIAQSSLRTGNAKSCGCSRKHINVTHGYSQDNATRAEYGIWLGMRKRCNQPACSEYKNYGGRGILICARWQDFSLFLQDVGPRPSINHSIDRVDNDGNYEPGNVRWATRVEQQNNTRTNHLISYKGETLTVAQWAKKLGISHDRLKERLGRQQWSIERAFTTSVLPANVKHNNTHLEFEGRTQTISEWAKEKGFPRRVLWNRIMNHKWSAQRAFSTPHIPKNR